MDVVMLRKNLGVGQIWYRLLARTLFHAEAVLPLHYFSISEIPLDLDSTRDLFSRRRRTFVSDGWRTQLKISMS